MKYWQWYDWVGFSITTAFLLFLIVKTVFSFVKEMRSRRKQYEALDDPFERSSVATYDAVVVSKETELLHRGSPKSPKHQVVFRIVFRTGDDRQLKLEVPESVYIHLREEQHGTLALEDHCFLDFE